MTARHRLREQVPRTEAEEILGLRLAQQALRLDPDNREAQVVQISLALEKAIERVGFSSFPAKDPATFAAAKASGPSILSEVLKTAVADGKTDLAATAATALGQVIDRAALDRHGPASPAGRCTLCPESPRPVRRRQGPGEPGADRAISRIEPDRPHPGPVCDQPGFAPSGGDRQQPHPGKPARRLLDQPWI